MGRIEKRPFTGGKGRLVRFVNPIPLTNKEMEKMFKKKLKIQDRTKQHMTTVTSEAFEMLKKFLQERKEKELSSWTQMEFISQAVKEKIRRHSEDYEKEFGKVSEEKKP